MHTFTARHWCYNNRMKVVNKLIVKPAKTMGECCVLRLYREKFIGNQLS